MGLFALSRFNLAVVSIYVAGRPIIQAAKYWFRIIRIWKFKIVDPKMAAKIWNCDLDETLYTWIVDVAETFCHTRPKPGKLVKL